MAKGTDPASAERDQRVQAADGFSSDAALLTAIYLVDMIAIFLISKLKGAA